jgi:hypothetical protein
VFPAQRGQFTDPQVGERGQQHQGAVSLRYRVEERSKRDHGPLVGVLLPSALDVAGVPANPPVLYRRHQDRAQQPVGLRDGDRPEWSRCLRSRVEAFLPPAPYVALPDVGESALPKVGWRWFFSRPRYSSSVRGLSTWSLTHVSAYWPNLSFPAARVEPVAAPDLGFLHGEPDISVRSGREGLRRWPVDAVRPRIASLVAARWELAHRPNRRFAITRHPSNKSCRVRRTADLAEGGRRQVSTLLSPGFEPCRKTVPLPVTGRVDRCWDVVPADGVSTVPIRSPMVLPLAAGLFRQR